MAKKKKNKFKTRKKRQRNLGLQSGGTKSKLKTGPKDGWERKPGSDWKTGKGGGERFGSKGYGARTKGHRSVTKPCYV